MSELAAGLGGLKSISRSASLNLSTFCPLPLIRPLSSALCSSVLTPVAPPSLRSMSRTALPPPRPLWHLHGLPVLVQQALHPLAANGRQPGRWSCLLMRGR